MRAEGLAALTLRRLADDLGASPPAIYRYVRDKEELILWLGDALFAEVELPTERDGDWAEQLAVLVRNTRQLLVGYPGLGVYVVEATRMFPTPNAMRLANASLRLLADAGLGPEEAASAHGALRHLGTIGLPPDLAAGATAMSVPARGFESLYAAAPFMTSNNEEASFEFGLRCLLGSLRAQASQRR